MFDLGIVFLLLVPFCSAFCDRFSKATGYWRVTPPPYSSEASNCLCFFFSGSLPLEKRETFMPFLRRHSNGGWVIYSLADEEILGLTAPTLAEAKGIADSLAVVSHVCNEECNDACNEWVHY
jgi:hypothetical protein